MNYGSAKALATVDAAFPSGAVNAVVGPNGAGKSSLLQAIYGSVPATGRIQLDGRDISAMTASGRAGHGIALVPQGRQTFPRLSVRENLQVMADFLKLGKDRVESALDRFPVLRERARSLAGVLSGGEQQMLAVSRALMTRPSVLLLDEMSTGLAPLVVADLLRTVRLLAEEGTIVVLAEPSLGPMRRHVDSGYVLLRGGVVAHAEDGDALQGAYERALGVAAGAPDGGQ